MGEQCGDNRFLIIDRAKKTLLEETNITSSPKEIEVLDSFLFRCWQMGWLNKFDLEYIKGRELAKKFMDEIIYDNDFVNHWNPFDEEKHYGNWINEIGRSLIFPLMRLGEDFFTEDFISMFSCGDADEMEANIKEHPELRYLHELLNQYYEYLETIPWSVPGIEYAKEHNIPIY